MECKIITRGDRSSFNYGRMLKRISDLIDKGENCTIVQRNRTIEIKVHDNNKVPKKNNIIKMEDTNKYQEALDRLETLHPGWNQCSYYSQFTRSNDPFMEDIEIIQELITRSKLWMK